MVRLILVLVYLLIIQVNFLSFYYLFCLFLIIFVLAPVLTSTNYPQPLLIGDIITICGTNFGPYNHSFVFEDYGSPFPITDLTMSIPHECITFRGWGSGYVDVIIFFKNHPERQQWTPFYLTLSFRSM